MRKYLVDLSVDGKRTQITVSARTAADARKLAEAQFAGSKVTIMFVKEVH